MSAVENLVRNPEQQPPEEDGTETTTLPEISNIQKSTRQRVFEAVLKADGQLPEEFQRTPDLSKPTSETEQERAEMTAIKEGATKAREVVLEQKRVVSILKESLQNALATPMPQPIKTILETQLPKILQELERPTNELFDAGLDIDYETQALNEYIQANLQKSLGTKTAEALAKEFVEGEIKLATATLEAMRKRPVLAHRVRGFGKDEASYQALKGALEAKAMEIEIDIRGSKDQTPTIHHNATLGNLANQPDYIKDLTDQQLAQRTLKNGEYIATLRQLFELTQETGNEVTKINIDIKDFDETMLDEILTLIKEFKAGHRVQIVSWFPQALQYMYEKEPTLQYSMSYFPTLNGATKWIFDRLQNPYGGAHEANAFFNAVATHIAKKRAEAAAKGEPVVQGTGAEQITNGFMLDPELHWKELKRIAQESGKETVGKHTFAAGGPPTEMQKMAQVLQYGSINMQAFHELPGIDKIPGLKWLFQKHLQAAVELARECATLGIKVNIFDLKQPGNIEEHFRKYEEENLQAGVVYSSNPDTVPQVTKHPKHTRKSKKETT